ncbi:MULTISPECIES: hypothetical protein [Burkholderia]|uniref:Uncharacterized protein n=1 Tax=Burkholderia sola TaxID=2843302 RepID=A0ABV2C374_9BURK|nr:MULTISPECIES: hypothetical protein [unclassified Burkholderia]MBP0605645.1 hypothetical protein [Burkholderia sp. CpTa8-5]MBP0712518.1 hypothetical protein [Burkholderia sp. AcTa6-5]
MLQTVKKGSSLHVVGRSTARIGEAARFGVLGDTRERPWGKARRAVVRARNTVGGGRRAAAPSGSHALCVACQPGMNDERAEPPRRVRAFRKPRVTMA